MKKLLIFTNILMLAVIVYLLIGKKESVPDTSQEVSSDKLKGSISFHAAEIISHLYGEDSAKSKTVINVGEGKFEVINDTKSIGYRLKDLNDFIAGIESAAKKIDCQKPLGVRIYFSKYPDEETMRKIPSLQDLPKEYANKLTFFFVPTILDGDRFRDFNPVDWTDCDNPPYYVKKQTAKSAGGGDWIFNHGDLIPPPLPGDEFPETSN